MKKLFKNAVIITANEKNEWYEHGYLLIENDQIIEVGAGDYNQEGQCAEVHDVKQNWIMPGWINTHGHAAMSILRGLADDLPLQEWLETNIWPTEAKYTQETVKYGSALAIVEMLKSGTTCFVDMYDNMDQVAQMVEQSGMRAVLTRGIIGFGSEEEQKKKVEEGYSFAKNWKGSARGRIQTMMSPHAPYTCSPTLIRRIVDKAVQIGVPVHIHMSETMREVILNVKEYGRRPVAHLQDIGVFEHPTLVAHSVHVQEEEMDIMKEHDVKVSHNPASNLKLGSGVAPVAEMLNKGIDVSVGTDSTASNNNLDMFQEVRLAALIHKGVQQDPTLVSAETALQMGTAIAARCAFLQETGTLEKNKQADFIIIDTEAAHLQPATNPISHIVYSASGADVRDVYIQGEAVVKNKTCLTMDEEKIVAEANRVLQDIQKR